MPNLVVKPVPKYFHTLVIDDHEYTIFSSELGITRLMIGDPSSLWNYTRTIANVKTDLISAASNQLMEYFAGRRKTFDLELDYSGNNLQLNVWKFLLGIEYGKTNSYKDIGESIGIAYAYRAVGTAVGQNPLPIFIPCHRIIRKSGKIGNYSANGGGKLGAEYKEHLLNFEKNNIE